MRDLDEEHALFECFVFSAFVQSKRLCETPTGVVLFS